jgi:Tfp pilus assembly protein FimV
MAPTTHHPRKFMSQFRAVAMGLASCSVLAVALMHAEPVSAAAAAATEAEAAPKPAASYTPRKGETLDHVIQITMPDSPLKMDLLRRAFISQNPQAFVTPITTPPRMKKGAVLTVPDHKKLLLSVAAPLTAEVDADATGSQRSPAAASSAEERKRWVRYP